MIEFLHFSTALRKNICMGQMSFFSRAETAAMRDRTKARNYDPGRDEFRRQQRIRRDCGLQRRHAEKLRRLHESGAVSRRPSAIAKVQARPERCTSRPMHPGPARKRAGPATQATHPPHVPLWSRAPLPSGGSRSPAPAPSAMAQPVRTGYWAMVTRILPSLSGSFRFSSPLMGLANFPAWGVARRKAGTYFRSSRRYRRSDACILTDVSMSITFGESRQTRRTRRPRCGSAPFGRGQHATAAVLIRGRARLCRIGDSFYAPARAGDSPRLPTRIDDSACAQP
jgi:hypothetical protein